MSRLIEIARFMRLAALCWLILLPLASTVAKADQPGAFDFYVLSLSWSPSYCAGHPQDRVQCGGTLHGFIMHGLWPQYERGFPNACGSGRDPLPRPIVDRMLDLMPSPGLVRHEWQTHGTCSGLDPAAYFALARQARAAVVLPPGFETVSGVRTLAPRAIENAFLAANRGVPAGNLSPAGIAVTCLDGQLQDVRICLTKDMQFRTCPGVDRAACRQFSIAVPPIRP